MGYISFRVHIPQFAPWNGRRADIGIGAAQS